ncbi:MAG: ribosome biogenesis GTPase Der [Ignavibacteriales bacterium]|nr:ribosome biogenesis GTPase Der [Ignavibacteriales bacterium]
MANILAIIGRPNVGKSTLFNRILGARDAIVHDQPGVTRDRLYATTEWTGKQFTIIDTGGYVPHSTDLFERAIREQAEIAISEADAVIFMVDAATGITTLDEELSNILRRSNKNIFLVVNKVDNEKREIDASQFFKLGLGEPLTISALMGRKIGDFLDEVTKFFPAVPQDEEEDKRLKIAVVGKPNVGKSLFVNALLGKSRHIVTPIPGTTRDAIDSILKYQKEQIVLIDTAGLRRRSRIKENIEFYSSLRALKSIDRCNIAILMVDVEAGLDKQDLRILEDIIERRRGVVLVVNKWDTVEKDDQTARYFEKAIKRFLRVYDYVPLIFISAIEKQRIYKVIDLAKEVFAEQTKRVSTNKLNKLLLQDIQSKPPSAKSGKEIKINYITQVKTNPPAFGFFVNEPKLVEEKYKRFLEGRIREHFGFIGVPVSLYFKKKN